jgi:CcmD family protein
MNKPLSILLTVLLSLLFLQASAQESTLDEAVRTSDKMYAVVAVIAVIFIGIVIYLAVIDRKVAKLEKEIKNK